MDTNLQVTEMFYSAVLTAVKQNNQCEGSCELSDEWPSMYFFSILYFVILLYTLNYCSRRNIHE